MDSPSIFPDEPRLPAPGRIECALCHAGPVSFDRTRAEGDGWRVTANPLAWGNPNPEVLVLGFSKGPSQTGGLSQIHHDQIAFRKGRANVRKILAHVGLVDPEADMDRLIADRAGRFARGSLIRCTVERHEGGSWKGSGGGMLDRFVATPFGSDVARRCTRRFLAHLPPRTRLVVLFGLGSRGRYVDAAERLIRSARPGRALRRISDIAYADEETTFVHVEHFAAQGRLIPDWLGVPDALGHVPDRARLGRLVALAVEAALA
jgi:hypothetical protein